MLLFPSWDPFLDTSAQMAERDMVILCFIEFLYFGDLFKTVVWESDFMVFYDKIKRSEDPDIIKLMTTARIVSNKVFLRMTNYFLFISTSLIGRSE